LSRHLESLVKELPLGEAHPPLVRLSITVSIEEVKETDISLLTDLLEVGADNILVTTVCRLGAETTKSKGAITGNGKVLDGIRVKNLISLTLGLVSALHEACVDVEGDVDEQTIGVTAHIESAEHDVGLEEVKSLIDDILRVHGGVRSGALELCCVTDGQDRDVADVPPVAVLHRLTTIGFFVKAGMVSSRWHCYSVVSSNSQ